MIPDHLGVNPKIAFSSHRSDQILRIDGSKTTCRFHDLKWSSTEAFLRTCKARQTAIGWLSKSVELKSYECEGCECGAEVLAGRRKTIPSNHGLIK